jgi:hypothetical protein
MCLSVYVCMDVCKCVSMYLWTYVPVPTYIYTYIFTNVMSNHQTEKLYVGLVVYTVGAG